MDNVPKSLVAKRRAELRRLHKIYSWREIAERPELYNGEIKHGILQRFCDTRNGKNYVPKDKRILEILGLISKRSQFHLVPKYFKRSRETLIFFKKQEEIIRSMGADTMEALKKR